MENENVIGKVCFAILRKGFVAGLRISLELDSPGCIIGCKFDGAGIVGNTVIDDSDILLHITSHGIQTEKGHTTGDRSVFYIGVGAALKLSGRRKIENVSRAAGACAHFEPVGCLYITGCFQRKKRCCGDFRIMQRCGRLLCGGTFVVACPRIGRCACKQIGGDGNLYRCGGEIGNCTVAKVCIRTEATALGRVLSALLLGNNQTITQKFLDVLNRRNPFYQIRLLIQGECFRQILVRSVIQRIPTRLFKQAVNLSKQARAIEATLGDITPFNAGKKKEEALAMLKKWFPQMENFSGQLKKYKVTINDLLAENEKLEARAKASEKGKMKDTMERAKLKSELDNLQRLVDRIPPDILAELKRQKRQHGKER